MTKREIEQAYVQHDALLHKLSHQCARRCGRPERDVYGQACYLFMMATSEYDPVLGEFGTYLFSFIRNGLVDWGRENDLPVDPICVPEHATTLDPARSLEFKDWLADLSEECREVALIILNGPAEILEFNGGNLHKITARAISKFLRSRGWGWVRIWRTLRDLKAAVAAM